jgi:hypothetical protein
MQTLYDMAASFEAFIASKCNEVFSDDETSTGLISREGFSLLVGLSPEMTSVYFTIRFVLMQYKELLQDLRTSVSIGMLGS